MTEDKPRLAIINPQACSRINAEVYMYTHLTNQFRPINRFATKLTPKKLNDVRNSKESVFSPS